VAPGGLRAGRLEAAPHVRPEARHYNGKRSSPEFAHTPTPGHRDGKDELIPNSRMESSSNFPGTLFGMDF